MSDQHANQDPPQGPKRQGPTIDLPAADVTETRPTEPTQNDVEQPARAQAAGSPIFVLLAGLLGGFALACLIAAGLWYSGAIMPPAVTGVAPRVAQLEEQLRALSMRPAAPDNRALSEIAARLTRLETAPRDTNSPQELAALRGRVDELAAALRATQGRAESAATLAEQATQTTRENSAQVARSDVEPLAQRIAALEQAAKTAETEINKSQTAAAADDRISRRAIAASALRDAVERGQPFGAELAVAKTLAPDDKQLQPLDGFTEQGLPSNQMLARELSGLLAPLRASSEKSNEQDGDWMQRLKSNAQRLVRIQRVGEAPSDDPGSVLSQIELKAARGDVDGAIADLGKLPEPLRAPTNDFVKKVQARNGALAAARDFAREALAALGKAPS